MNGRMGICAAACLLLMAGTASAALVEVSFEGAVINVSNGLSGTVSAGHPVSGSFTVDTSVAGAFTPAADAFTRDEMLYAGAVTSVSFTIAGEVLTGGGGDVTLFDANGAFDGEDEYMARAALSDGQLGGVGPGESIVDLFYPRDTFGLAPGSALFGGPPPRSLATFAAFYLDFEPDALSPSGNFLSGSVTSISAVPLPAAVWLLGSAVLGLMAGGGLISRSRVPANA